MPEWLMMSIVFLLGLGLGMRLRGPREERPPLPPRFPPGSLPELEAEVRELYRAGQKIQAIKLYRENTGVGLKEAKDAVEALDRE